MRGLKANNAAAAQAGGDHLTFDITQNGPISANLGTGYDTVAIVDDDSIPQVRITFTSAEVGNDNANDAGTLLNQDGGLAVRVQAEDGSGTLVGPVSRFDDEGISFISDGSFTFDVRDLVSGAARGDLFGVVRLGTIGTDMYDERPSIIATYINAGMGDDEVVGGSGNDFLVGGAGDDRVQGSSGNDTFIGGLGNDMIYGNADNDTAIINISLDGADRIDLGDGTDMINLSAATTVSQIRLTFTSAEVGNGTSNDANMLLNQDGGLAVRMQAEDASGALAGTTTRVDDEGISFISTGAFTFDVRDLVSGAARGDQFKVVRLGTLAGDIFDEGTSTLATYINAGMGNDMISGGLANDFLVGGAGDDRLRGAAGNDSFIGGGGNDNIVGAAGNDTAIVNASTDGSDVVNLGTGSDTVNVAVATGTTQVRLTFTSAEVGNDNARDSGTLANQDGGLAVRVQTEDSTGALTGAIGRYDDEGITFVSTTPGATFEVRDLVSGASRGDQFQVAILGTIDGDLFDRSAETRVIYVNAGAGNDMITGGTANDFLVGNIGDDVLNGTLGNDSLLGGGGFDMFAFTATPGNDSILDFVSGTDKIDLSAFGIDETDLSFTMSGANTIVGVDTTGDMTADFQITLINVGQPMTADFVF